MEAHDTKPSSKGAVSDLVWALDELIALFD
jgi:hypothetical protein